MNLGCSSELWEEEEVKKTTGVVLHFMEKLALRYPRTGRLLHLVCKTNTTKSVQKFI